MNEDKRPLGFMINYLGKSFKRAVNEECQKHGINGTYSQIIILLMKNPHGITQNFLCDKLHLSAPTVSLTIKNMENEGLIVREQAKDDSRKLLVYLSNKGKEMDQIIADCYHTVEMNMVKGLREEEIEELRTKLDLLINNLTEGEN